MEEQAEKEEQKNGLSGWKFLKGKVIDGYGIVLVRNNFKYDLPFFIIIAFLFLCFSDIKDNLFLLYLIFRIDLLWVWLEV